jgi:putative two-component system response regulator
MRILIVDDDATALQLLQFILEQEGYDVTVARNGKEAMDFVRTGQFRLVISDWDMPEMNGVELCDNIRKRGFANYVYIILLTSRDRTADLVQGMDGGADDFLVKPVEPHELCVRLRAARRLLSIESRDFIIFALAKLADSRDPETGEHLERMRKYARLLAQQLGKSPEYRDVIDGDYIEMLYLTSPLHDIGKVAIPDRVLCKPGRLTPEEYEIMKTHAALGAQTLAEGAKNYPDAKYLQMAQDLTRTHHERYDGTGYPAGLAGEDIPLCGRIVALADFYDALTSDRVYRSALSHEETREMIVQASGSHFDPDIVEAFLQMEDDFKMIQSLYGDAKSSPSPQLEMAQ